MQISRRAFLKYCTASAAALGLAPQTVRALERLLLSPAGPNVLWLEGLACSGCSVSFLNHISSTAPYDAADVLINVINLAYHGTLMAAAGDAAVRSAYDVAAAGNYILVVEGAVPSAFDGWTCFGWHHDGVELNFRDVVNQLAPGASHIVCIGECASYGGINAAPPNPSGAQSVQAATGRATINIAGCPPHPTWLVWALAQLLAGGAVPLDAYGRPTQFFSYTIHNRCPLRSAQEATNWGQETLCKEALGCRGKLTHGNCPNLYFNGGVNWCIGSGSHCIGCTSPTFPGTNQFFTWDS